MHMYKTKKLNFMWLHILAVLSPTDKKYDRDHSWTYVLSD